MHQTLRLGTSPQLDARPGVQYERPTSPELEHRREDEDPAGLCA